jgi:hypothetical protein
MIEPPASVIAAALEWCRLHHHESSDNYRAVFVPKGDELNPPDETRDLWHIFFYPESLKLCASDFFVIVVDPQTLQVEGHD